MRKLLLCTLSCLLITGICHGQAKQTKPVKPADSALKKLLASTGLPYSIINDSLATVPFEGTSIASYDVLIQKAGDLYIVYTNLTEIMPGKIDESKFKYLLQRNNDFDIIKTGLDGDSNMVYVRADVFRTGITSAVMKRIIRQVANVTNIIGNDLK